MAGHPPPPRLIYDFPREQTGPCFHLSSLLEVWQPDSRGFNPMKTELNQARADLDKQISVTLGQMETIRVLRMQADLKGEKS